MLIQTAVSCLVLLPALVLGSSAAASPQACNNSPSLCDRAYNNVTYLGAHDSPFIRNSTNDYDIAGDQFYSAVDALGAGVRLLSGQVHQYTDLNGTVEWHLCHTDCILYDAGPLGTWLSGIKQWMDANPDEVVTLLIVNSDNANATVLDGIFKSSGINTYGYVPSETTKATTSWPTLGQLISQNKRLMTFIASLDPSSNTVAPYLLDEFTFIFENPYENDTPSEFNCTANRPASLNGNTQAALASGRMGLMNHFLYDKIIGIEIPAVEQVDNTNAETGTTGNLGASAANCTVAWGHPPNFVLVDFWNVGPAIATIDKLNGVTAPVGRNTSYPTTAEGSDPQLSSTVSSSSTTSASSSASSSSSLSTKTPTIPPSTLYTSTSSSDSLATQPLAPPSQSQSQSQSQSRPLPSNPVTISRPSTLSASASSTPSTPPSSVSATKTDAKCPASPATPRKTGPTSIPGSIAGTTTTSAKATSSPSPSSTAHKSSAARSISMSFSMREPPFLAGALNRERMLTTLLTSVVFVPLLIGALFDY